MISINKTLQIVLVDDDSETQDLISAFFKPKGVRVSFFSDAEAAIEASIHDGSGWDVLLANFRLPKKSGIDLIVELKKGFPKLPIILITEFQSTETAVEAIKQGAFDFVVKPINFLQLQNSIARAVQVSEFEKDLGQIQGAIGSTTEKLSKVVGCSPAFLKALDMAKRVAKSSTTIMISGESGTGKEVFARLIHAESKHSTGPFIAINCSAIPENLLESELFGHAKGSFTGAIEKRVGLFEEAQNGTLFLDEVGDLSMALQAKLLRVIQERKIKRVGENQTRAINCRIISATHKDLTSEVLENRFREDLYFRLNVIPIEIPPLREREGDILVLANLFLRRFALENGSAARAFSKEAIKYLMENCWKGNIRELENAVERAVVLSDEFEISLADLKPCSTDLFSGERIISNGFSETQFSVSCPSNLPSLDEVIQKYIEFAVHKRGGARDKTAKEIGIDRKTLYKWISH